MRLAAILAMALTACGTSGEEAPAPRPAPGPAAANDEPRADAVKVAPNGRDFAEGTAEAPVASFARAIALASEKGTDVVACAGTYVENIVVDRPVRIFGDRSCSDWKASSAHARIAPEMGMPLAIRASDVRIVAVDVVASVPHFFPGTPAIGVFVANAARVTLIRMTVRAGLPTAGEDAPPAKSNRVAAAAPGGAAVGAVGGAGQTCACVDQSLSKGGTGASADMTASAGDGTADPSSGFGKNGGASGASTCTPGGAGAVGAAGVAGMPVEATSRAFVVNGDGVTTTAGANGGSGAPGQGGGGGGAIGSSSAAGGGGGCGGCGGAGGRGGGAGGSSIALLSFESDVTIESSELASADGAKGGAGSGGLPGDPGAIGGAGACEGGAGGSGGSGAGGAGGGGGASLAVFYVGTRPALVDTRVMFGRGGTGGAGGAPNGKAGAEGITGEIVGK